jgi:UTP--glucose-1-phosphate uridylyltransferase
LGTRSLPATKVIPKEMLPIFDRPLIQFAVEEASASGLERVILIIPVDDSLVAEHFRRDLNLENTLRARGKSGEADLICRLSKLADIRTVRQEFPLGLADAIRCARPLLADETFAVILPDALIDSSLPCVRQLMNCYEKHPGCLVATQMVDPSEIERFGMLDVTSVSDSWSGDRVMRVVSLTERPKSGSVSLRFGIFGRYILEPEIFSYIDGLKPGFGCELQLTDALRSYSERFPLYAYRFEGEHYDAGSKLGFLKATIAFALKDPKLAEHLREYLQTLELPVTTTQ